MPSIETSSLRDTAVLFARLSGRSGYDSMGRPKVYAQEEVCCRIEYSTSESRAVDNANEQIVARMYVCQDITIGSIVWHGREIDLPDDLDDLTDLMQVVSFDKVPDIKNRVHQRTANLSRYHNKLPTIGT